MGQDSYMESGQFKNLIQAAIKKCKPKLLPILITEKVRTYRDVTVTLNKLSTKAMVAYIGTLR